MLIWFLAFVGPLPEVVPLRHAHAHNDYAQRRPLLDALDHGFNSVEADVFLYKGRLYVGHTWLEVLPEAARKEPTRTLEKLYLEPLAARAKRNGGRIYPRSEAPFFLLIDLKTGGDTYDEVHKALARFPDTFTEVNDRKVIRRGVTVVISGQVPREAIRSQKRRFASIDGRPSDLDSEAPAHLMPLISASWGSQFRWRGEGPMPDKEREKLIDFVRRAHKQGRLVRFWATPEKPALWKELRAAGVDLINTDQLAQLRRFLLEETPPRERKRD